MADLAGHIHIRQKIHLNLIHTVALAGLAATALHIKAKASRFVATHFGLVGLAEELTDKIKDAY